MKDITYDYKIKKWKTSDGFYFNTFKKAINHQREKSKKKGEEVKQRKTDNNKLKNKDDGTK